MLMNFDYWIGNPAFLNTVPHKEEKKIKLKNDFQNCIMRTIG